MDDDGGEQVEPGHAILLALDRVIEDFALAPDPECEAQPVVSPAPHPDMLDVVVGQPVMTQHGGLVRGQVEQGRALPCAPDASSPYTSPLTATLIGYARYSTDRQDPAAQRQALLKLGVAEDRIYTDHGLTGTTRARPGLDQALTAVREGDTLVVPKLDRQARSVPDARAIADRLRERGVKLALGRALYDPGDPMGKLFFNILATFAEFEADLIRMRTREGMAIARARGKLRGKQPKLSDRQQRELCRMHATGEYSISDLAELFSVSRPTVYRTLNRRHSP